MGILLLYVWCYYFHYDLFPTQRTNYSLRNSDIFLSIVKFIFLHLNLLMIKIKILWLELIITFYLLYSMTAPGLSSHLFTGVKHRNEAFPHFQPRRYGLTKDQYLAKITPAGQLRKQAQLCRSIYAWRGCVIRQLYAIIILIIIFFDILHLFVFFCIFLLFLNVWTLSWSLFWFCSLSWSEYWFRSL